MRLLRESAHIAFQKSWGCTTPVSRLPVQPFYAQSIVARELTLCNDVRWRLKSKPPGQSTTLTQSCASTTYLPNKRPVAKDDVGPFARRGIGSGSLSRRAVQNRYRFGFGRHVSRPSTSSHNLHNVNFNRSAANLQAIGLARRSAQCVSRSGYPGGVDRGGVCWISQVRWSYI